MNSNPLIGIICFDVVQFFYILYLLVVRPFNLVGMIMNILGELAIFFYFIYLTIKPEPAQQKHYKIIIIMMVVIFIITYLISLLEIFYSGLWYLYKKRKNQVRNTEDDYPQQKSNMKSTPKDDTKKYGAGKSVDNSIPTWRYTPETA